MKEKHSHVKEKRNMVPMGFRRRGLFTTRLCGLFRGVVFRLAVWALTKLMLVTELIVNFQLEFN